MTREAGKIERLKEKTINFTHVKTVKNGTSYSTYSIFTLTVRHDQVFIRLLTIRIHEASKFSWLYSQHSISALYLSILYLDI